MVGNNSFGHKSIGSKPNDPTSHASRGEYWKLALFFVGGLAIIWGIVSLLLRLWTWLTTPPAELDFQIEGHVGLDPPIEEEPVGIEPQAQEGSVALDPQARARLPEKTYGGESMKMPFNNRDCSLCLEDFSEGDKLISLPCQHTFCKECILGYLERANKCPYCSQVVSISEGTS